MGFLIDPNPICETLDNVLKIAKSKKDWTLYYAASYVGLEMGIAGYKPIVSNHVFIKKPLINGNPLLIN